MDQPLGSKYMLHELVGRGAMGQVYRGTIREIGTPVAVKILKPELVSDPDVVARFFQERSILLSIDHPNVVRILDLVVEGETVGIVMELVENQDLRRELLATPTLPPAEVARYGCEVFSGLAAVHEAGIVHRDVKPENLLIDTTGSESRLKLTDFGVARLTYGGSLTKLSSLIGTPEYMAPEIADHETATPAADLYSAGIVLYEMLSGRTPFAGGHPMAVLRRHLDEEPPAVPGAPAPMLTLIDSLLAKDPDSRPQSALQAAAALTAMKPSLVDLPALTPMPALAFRAVTPRRSTAHPDTQAVPRSSLATAPDVEVPALTDEAGLTIDAPSRAVRIRIPPPDGTSRPETAPRASDGGTAARRADASGRDDPARPWFRRSGPRFFLALALAALVAAATVITVRHPFRSPETSHAAQAVSYAFAPQDYPNDLLIVRHWTLSGPDGSQLTETITASSTDGRPHAVSFTEAIPPVLAAVVKTVRFTSGAKVVQRHRLVRWRLQLPAQGTVAVGYRASVRPAGATRSRLARWADALTTMQKQFHLVIPADAAIQSLVISPAAIQMFSNQTVQLMLEGQLENGSSATQHVLGSVTWASANPAVATVSSSGLVTATGAGDTDITARVRGILASASLVVLNPPPVPVSSSPSPSQTSSGTGPAPCPTCTYRVFHSCRGLAGCGLIVRSGPGSSYSEITTLPNKATIQIACQVTGELETNTKGIASYVWDELNLSGQAGYVSDLYVNTHGALIAPNEFGFTPAIPQC